MRLKYFKRGEKLFRVWKIEKKMIVTEVKMENKEMEEIKDITFKELSKVLHDEEIITLKNVEKLKLKLIKLKE